MTFENIEAWTGEGCTASISVRFKATFKPDPKCTTSLHIESRQTHERMQIQTRRGRSCDRCKLTLPLFGSGEYSTFLVNVACWRANQPRPSITRTVCGHPELGDPPGLAHRLGFRPGRLFHNRTPSPKTVRTSLAFCLVISFTNCPPPNLGAGHCPLTGTGELSPSPQKQPLTMDPQPFPLAPAPPV